ncbi:hypothetical protein LCGC14_0549880, partial [marine sediment metagenome]
SGRLVLAEEEKSSALLKVYLYNYVEEKWDIVNFVVYDDHTGTNTFSYVVDRNFVVFENYFNKTLANQFEVKAVFAVEEETSQSFVSRTGFGITKINASIYYDTPNTEHMINPELEFDIDITEYFENGDRYLEQIKLDLFFSGEIEFDDAFLFSQYALLEENYDFYLRNEYLDFEKFSLENDEIILSREEIDRLLFHDINNNKYYIRAKLEYDWNCILEMNLGSNSKLEIISLLNLIKYDLFTAYTSYETTRISSQKINTSYNLVEIMAPNYIETDNGISVLGDDTESDIGVFGGFMRNVDTRQRLMVRQQVFYNFTESQQGWNQILLDQGYTDVILKFLIPFGYLASPLDYITNTTEFIFVSDTDVAFINFYYDNGTNYIKGGNMTQDSIYLAKFTYTWLDVEGDTGTESGDFIKIMFNITDILENNGLYEYSLVADFDVPTPDLTIGNGTQNYESGLIATPDTPISFNSNEFERSSNSQHYSWNESLNSYDGSYMSHTYSPDDHSSSYIMNPLNMETNFPSENTIDDWNNWNLNYDPAKTTSSFSNGNLTSYINSGPDFYTPNQPDDFNLIKGSFAQFGDLKFIDGNISKIDSDYGVFPSNEYINSISITWGYDGDGTLAGTRTDADWNWKRIDSKQSGPNKWVDITFNINPTYAGRDFLFDFWSYVSVTSGTGTVRINGEAYGGAAKTIHFHNVLFEDVNSITFRSTTTNHDHYVQINHFKLVEANAAPPELDVLIDMEVENPDADTIDYLKYSHKTNQSQTIDLDIWNWITEQWYEIESVDNYATFNDDMFALGQGSQYVNSTNGIRIRYQAVSSNSDFQLEIDRLALNYTYIQFQGSIIKTVNDNFLNRYDTGFSNYKKLYNITTKFNYRFTKNNSAFQDLAQFSMNGNNFLLTKDNSWHSFEETVEFDSTSQNSFDFTFNISNGLLELDNMNYTLLFTAMDTNDHVLLGQNFNIEFNGEADLHELKNIIGVQFLLSASYNFTQTQDGKIYYNSFGRTNLFEIIYKIKADGVWYNNSYYATNLGETKIEVFNITQFMKNNGLSFFQDFAIEFVVSGNSSELTVDSVFLNATTDTKYIQEYYRIIDNIMGTVSRWKVLNSSAISVLDDLGELPDNFSIEYSVIDFAGNEGINTTYNTNYQNIIFSREKTITLSDDTIDLNLGGSREISFANTGQFDNTQFLDAYINGFNYGTAYLDNGYYKLSFGDSNSIDTLLGYSGSLISSNIYSNIDPLNHISWEVREDDMFASVKHVLVEEDIIINNPIAYVSFSALRLDHLYDIGFGLEDFIYIKQVFYYNTSESEATQQILSEFDYSVDENGIVTFPETSIVHDLYQNNTNVKDNLIYFEYYHTGEIKEHLSLPNADGFFINFTMPSIYYNHTTIERLVISFNDVLGNTYSVIFYDINLREYFLDTVKDKYKKSIFGLGQMMVIPLYISLEEIQLSNFANTFDLKLLDSITFTISDSERWPGSFIQEMGENSVLNLPYQRVGIQDIRLYNLISDSIDVDENGYVNSTVTFKVPNYYNFYASDVFKIKRLDIEFTNLKAYSYAQEIIQDGTIDVQYSDVIELNYRWNNSLSPVLLGDIYKLPITLSDATSNKIISLGLSYWITKIDQDSLSGYLTKYYYSQFEAPKVLGSFNPVFGSLGTPIFNISFADAPIFILNVTQESLLSNDPIYLSKDTFELEYGHLLSLNGVIRDDDQYIVEDEVYDYIYQEALDGQTVHHLKLISPFGDDEFIDKDEFAIYYVDNNLEKVPLYSTLNGGFYKDNSILKYSKNPEINYIDNAFLLNIYWKEDATNFINYDTILLISYKLVKGRPISPLSYSSVDSYGNDQQNNFVDIPFARYDMLSSDWITEDDFIEPFLVDFKLLYKDVQSINASIQGPQYNESQLIQTGIVDVGFIEVNKSYSNKFVDVNSTEYSWNINSTGDLIISNLNYTSGDNFRVWYYASNPVIISHPLNKSVSQISYLSITNQTGYVFNLTINQDYKLSNDGYSIYFLDLYNNVYKSCNFSMYDSYSIKYHAPLSRKIDLSSNVLLLLQDSEGNDIPIDTVRIDSLGFFQYAKPLRLRGPFDLEPTLSLPLGGGKKLVHASLAYLPISVYNKSSAQSININYTDDAGNNVYPYKESNKWIKTFTITTIPDKVKLEIVEDITQDIVINQDFIKEREYIFNLNPSETLESGEEYTRVMIDALVKEEYELKFKLSEYEGETDVGTPVNNSIVWLHLGLMPKSKTKFLNDRALIDEYGIKPYFESLGTEEVTSRGPGTGANKMFGRPLTYELDNYNSNYSAYGPIIWTYGITNEFGEVSFNVSLDRDYLEMFTEIFGWMEGTSSVEDIVLYIRAFSSNFDWDEFKIDTPNQYLGSKDGTVYDGSNIVYNYDFTGLKLQDNTYVEGVINLHRNHITVGSNDHLSYTLPDGEIDTQFEPITVYIYGAEANIIPLGEFYTIDSLTKLYKSSELEPTHKSIFTNDSRHYAYINFVNPSGNVIESLYKEIHQTGESGYFTIDNETVATIMNKLITEGGPGISSIQIQIAQSEYFKASPILSFPIEIKASNWLKFGEKNTLIDLIDPFMNAYGSVFSGEEAAPFESNYPHLLGTIWVEPDFMGSGDEIERSIQDYVEINLIVSVLDEDGYETNFPLREGVMLRPGNRDGLMKIDVGLGPEDAFLMDSICSLNLSFSIDYNKDGIYNDSRDVTIYILDLRLESNPSSSTPNTLWSLYEDQTTSKLNALEISMSPSFSTINSNITLGSVMNGETYGIDYANIYESTSSRYAIDIDNELLTLFNLSKIEPMRIIGRQGGFDHNFTDWSVPFPLSESLYEQSTIQFNTDIPDDYTEFSVIYNFTFDFNNDKHYGKIQLGPNLGGESNESWIAFDLKDGFLSRDINNESFMFVRYNQSFMGDGITTSFTLDYTIEDVSAFNNSFFIVYNENELDTIGNKDLNNGYPRITFDNAPASGIAFDIIYGVRSQYELGYGFQKYKKPFSDSVRLIHNNDDISSIKPIMNSLGTIGAISVDDPSLYINLDNSPLETILELYDIPLFYDPEVNLTFKFDPIIVNQIKNLPDEANSLTIDFSYVLTDYNTYFTDSIEIPLNYTVIAPDLESDTYTITYNKDLQGIYESFGSTSLDIYISISQISNTSFIPYIILEQFDYLCDAHLVEMYSQMPKDENNNLDVSAVINTPHYYQIFSRPLIDGTQYGESPFGLVDGSEVTVGIEGLPYSRLVSLDGVVGALNFSDLGKNETLTISSENFYMIPNMGLFTDAYDIDETIYQDGFVNLYYGSGTEIDGEQYYSNEISMDYENSVIDNYESWVDNKVPTSWEDVFNITDQFLTTQQISVSGSVLYHQLFDLTTDIISNSELEAILGDITGADFGLQLPDSVYPNQIKVIGTPYSYDLSVQGFPIGDYIDGTYCKVVNSSRTRNFDTRLANKLLSSQDYSLEFASNGSVYIVFYQPTSFVQNFAAQSKIMIDYWVNFDFIEGFDYNIIENPEDPFASILDWDYKINSLNLYSMHPDFTIDSTFTIEFSALDWNSVDNTYIYDAEEIFSFKPKILTNITTLYDKYDTDNLDDFSVYGIIPNNQFNDTSVYQDVYVQIWKNQNESTIETYQLNEDPIMYKYIFQDEIESDYYWINFTKVESDMQIRKNNVNWTLVPDSYVFIEVDFVSDGLRYPLAHTPFNYDYIGAGHNAYHITLTIEGGNPVYSYDIVEFNKYVSKIEDNYIYFQDKDFTEEGYIANQSQITLEYKFKLQPGLIDQEHFLMAIYPWSNVFDTILQSGDGSISYREKYRKLSGSSIISPFEYSLSINDTYSLFLSYRLNRREFFEEKFEMDYSTGNLEFNYLQDGLDSYISEIDESAFVVYYYDGNGRAIELNDQLYTIDTNLHNLTLLPGKLITAYSGFNIGGQLPGAGYPYPSPIVRWMPNPIVEINEITEFYVSFFAKPYDSSFKSHTFTYGNPEPEPWPSLISTIGADGILHITTNNEPEPEYPNLSFQESLNVKYWSVVGGERLDVIPNFDAYYYYEVEESTYVDSVCRATQISAYLEEGKTLSYDLEGELSWYDSQLLDDIHDGDKYLALYMSTVIDNYEALDKVFIETYDNSATPNLISSFNILAKELIASDFTLKIDLPTSQNNGLKWLNFTPIFRTDAEFSNDNVIGVPRFESVEWDSTKTNYYSDGNRVMYYILEDTLFTEGTSYETAYLFNNNLEYLKLPKGIELSFTVEEIETGESKYILEIPEIYVNPNNPSENSTFKDGEIITIKYNSPKEKMIQIGIEELFFHKKPFNYETFPEVAEILLINTNNTLDYEQFTTPYSYNISIPITPFETEYLGDYKQLTVDINLTKLSQFADSGYVDFSNIVVSVPNPAYELTFDGIQISQEYTADFTQNEVLTDLIWRYTEREILVSSADPSADEYQLTLESEPLFYNENDKSKWLEHLNIYDENGNYYSAGLQGDSYQLIWNPSTGNFTWNDAFSQFQDYFGIDFYAPLVIEPDTELYFEYSTNNSWSDTYNFNYVNLNTGDLEIVYDYNYLLDPHYYTIYDTIFENDVYDYDFEQFYAESFTVYSNATDYSHIFDIDYDFQQDFTNLSLYKVVGLYPNYTQFFIEHDDVNYDVVFNPITKTINITDLISGDGVLNQFDSITVILNFTFGPVSSLTQLSLSSNFNQTFLANQEETISNEIYGSFYYFDKAEFYLFAEDYSTITSSQTSFSSINFTRNAHLGNSPVLKGYDEYELYLNFELSENPFNVIYEADIELDGKVDYKQEVDIDKDGTIDVTKYGVIDPANPLEIIWYKIIQDIQSISKTLSKDYEHSQTQTFTAGTAGKWGEMNIALHHTRRFITKYSETEMSQYTRVYSVRFDYDLDGYADSQVDYKKEEIVAEYSVNVVMKTIVKGIGGIGGGSYGARYLERFIQDTQLSQVTNVLIEELVYYDLEEGVVVETRHYTDKFVDDYSLFIAEDEINSLSITNQDTGEQTQVKANNLMFNASQISWEVDTWSNDNVPIKFESAQTISQNGEETFSNIHEKTKTIRISGRNSLFYDFLKESLPQQFPTTDFIVKGVFITPLDGVYYTSEKDKFFASSTHKEAKTTGHYLYYDSDLNGFYETVFILAPLLSEDDLVYDVIGIGYNYDGSHDFIPYDTILTTSKRYGSLEPTGYIKTTVSNPSKIYFGTGDVLKLDVLDDINKAYPYEFTDGTTPKDHIFEISKLVNPSDANVMYPELYYETYKQQFAKAYNSYENGLWDDVVREVGKSTIAGISSALAGAAFSLWLAPFVFAGVYFFFSWLDSLAAKSKAANLVVSRTFYSQEILDKQKSWRQGIPPQTYYRTPKNPPTLSERTSKDIDREGLVAYANNHKGAYYTDVFGGEPGNMYEAAVITSPPATWRAAILEEDDDGSSGWTSEMDTDGMFVAIPPEEVKGPMFTNFNLDYLLITSELPSLEGVLDAKYPLAKYTVDLNVGTNDRENLYNTYQTNTIGFLEQKIETVSDGQFDSIRPLVINGVPQYVFVNSNEEDISKTQPLSPLYSPIVISQSRYGELLSQGIYKHAVMSLLVNCEYGFVNNAFDAYQLHPGEAEIYNAKIPLSPSEFNYPIQQITIDLEEPLGGLIKTVEVDPSNYTVIEGNLYFYKTLEEIVFSSKAEWVGYAIKTTPYINRYGRLYYRTQRLDLNYNIHITFATVVPYDDGRADTLSEIIYENTGPSLMTGLFSILDMFHPGIPDIIDTTSNDLAKTALAQSTSYAISDYFNQVQMGYTDATNKAERDYTILVTFWSTLISNLVLLPVTVLTIASKMASKVADVALKPFTTFGKVLPKALVLALITVPAGVVTEILEELYVDPYIEIWVSRQITKLGGDEATADFVSLFVTSFREAFIGGVSSAVKGFKGGNKAGSGGTDVVTILTIGDKIAEIDSQKSWKSLISFDNALNILSAVPSFFRGGADLGVLSIGLELSTDLIQTKLENYYLKGLLETALAERIALAMKPAPVLDTSAIDISWLFRTKKTNVKTIPSVMPVTAIMTSGAMTMTMIPTDMLRDTQKGIAIAKLRVQAMQKFADFNPNFDGIPMFPSFSPNSKTNLQNFLKNELKLTDRVLEYNTYVNGIEVDAVQWSDFIISPQDTVTLMPHMGLVQEVKRIETEIEQYMDANPLGPRIMTTKLINPTDVNILRDYYARSVAAVYSKPATKQKSNNLAHTQFFFDSLAEILFKYTNLLEATVTTPQAGPIGYDHTELSLLIAPDSKGLVMSPKLSALKSGKDFRIAEITFQRYYAAIWTKIENSILIRDVKSKIISELDSLFENQNRFYGYTSDDNRVYHQAELDTQKVVAMLREANLIPEATIKELLTYLGRDPTTNPGIRAILGSFVYPKLERLRLFRDELLTALRNDNRLTINKKNDIIAKFNSIFETVIWRTKQLNKISEKIFSHFTTNTMKSRLIKMIVSSHDALLGIEEITELSELLFGEAYPSSTSRQTWMSRFIYKHEVGFVYPSYLFKMKKSISTWSQSDFDFNLNPSELGELQIKVTSIVDKFLHMERSGILSRASFNLYGKSFVVDKLKVLDTFWIAWAHFTDQQFLTLTDLSEQISQLIGGGFIMPKIYPNSKLRISKQTLSIMLSIIETIQMFEYATYTFIPNARLGAYENLLEAIYGYTAQYHLGMGSSSLSQNSKDDVHDFLSVNNPNSRGRPHVAPTFVSKSTFDNIPKTKEFDELKRHLATSKQLKGVPPYIWADKNRKSVSETFNRRLTGFRSDAKKLTKSTFIKNFIKRIISKKYRRGFTTNKMMRTLFTAAKGSGTGHGGAVSHEEVARRMRKSGYFLASEVPVWINTPNGDLIVGHIDMLLFDPKTNKLIVVDYKPDLSYSDMGYYSFINSVPQVAAYGLILQQMLGLDASSQIQVESVIFNRQGAWSFKPDEVLTPINEFMLKEGPTGWRPPWIDLMPYSK